jgi:hypothetical protein
VAPPSPRRHGPRTGHGIASAMIYLRRLDTRRQNAVVPVGGGTSRGGLSGGQLASLPLVGLSRALLTTSYLAGTLRLSQSRLRTSHRVLSSLSPTGLSVGLEQCPARGTRGAALTAGVWARVRPTVRSLRRSAPSRR